MEKLCRLIGEHTWSCDENLNYSDYWCFASVFTNGING
ncbi:hypothetical protein Y11_13101 [Yersinia enterocolitica subsp. palearctica Y11]|uniref:Uncharacterized protein n=1 Tax=Yersinia enterocolitica subsp. palearctica serotype O:3 (strain DSM 13030 / CIP 106945 / Y11) TaxID=930944 RepID=A0A0H3NP08_YERE1|nr:hypothetical protein Y11_13101 [Yersinia enterocolitica subsp. palearctica Y11]